MRNLQHFLFIALFGLPIETIAVSWLQNQEQQGQAAFMQGHYEEAARLFTDPYRRGIALYRDKKYEEAAKSFAAVTRPEVKVDALYNLGNSYFKQGNYNDAITSYEQALALYPNFEDARYNLELAKKQLNNETQQPKQTKKTQENGDQSDQSNDPKNDAASSLESEQKNHTSSEKNSLQDSSKPSKQQGSPADQNNSTDQTTPSVENFPETQMEQNNPSEAPQSSLSKSALPNETITGSEFSNETDKMADALLNRLQENPQQLLQRQFRLDAYHAKQANIPIPDKTW